MIIVIIKYVKIAPHFASHLQFQIILVYIVRAYGKYQFQLAGYQGPRNLLD